MKKHKIILFVLLTVIMIFGGLSVYPLNDIKLTYDTSATYDGIRS